MFYASTKRQCNITFSALTLTGWMPDLCALNSLKARSVTQRSGFFIIKMKKKKMLILAQPLKQDKGNNERQRTVS